MVIQCLDSNYRIFQMSRSSVSSQKSGNDVKNLDISPNLPNFAPTSPVDRPSTSNSSTSKTKRGNSSAPVTEQKKAEINAGTTSTRNRNSSNDNSPEDTNLISQKLRNNSPRNDNSDHNDEISNPGGSFVDSGNPNSPKNIRKQENHPGLRRKEDASQSVPPIVGLTNPADRSAIFTPPPANPDDTAALLLW